ncbi:hypothetical protein B296_00032975 [Ensete ventricosum]|uniref:Calcium-transporting ATPase n=1 Tax=Ensete ventricosum TaxID=4639 RepID=A0A426ZF73_ENSVE|nr:hypothetical protein B296_00032975 [Ensete ventricosum]
MCLGIALHSEYNVPDEVKKAGFQICPDELGSIVEGHDVKKLKVHGGVNGIADKLSTSTTNGLTATEESLNHRQNIYGVNKFTESQVRSFWVFVWEALQDMTLIILAVCACISLFVGIATEGWPKGAHDGLGIVASILLVVFVTATSDYRQSLQFKDLDKEKKKISVQVTRDGFRQKISIYDLLPGDLAHLAIGDQVPADGLFMSGFSLLINESSLTGESEPVNVNADNPFLLSGTKVQDGSCKMLVTTVGMRSQWGKLMATLSEGGDDETPLQVKLNGVATIIGKIGLVFAVVTFAVLAEGLIKHKFQEGSYLSWSADDALELLEYFAVGVTIVVVAVPEGLPLAVTLSLAFAMKKMMNDRALVRHLAACETMGSATSICSDKTGTLTTNHMTLVKACICGNINEVNNHEEIKDVCSQVPDVALKVLLQSIFYNTGGEVVINQAGKLEILGTPTETALLEFGLLLGGDFQVARQETKIVKVEPFNSEKKRMGVVLQLPGGGYRAHCKGASEIILAACDKVLDSAVDFFSYYLSNLLTYQVMARSSPMDKHTLVKHLRTMFNEVVAVTGDGTNDAPALHEADIGLAMGIAGTEVVSLIMQVFNEISCREMEKIDVFHGILENYVFTAVITCTIIFQFIIVQFLGDFANTTPLTLYQWFACVFIGFLGMPISAAIKMVPVGCK